MSEFYQKLVDEINFVRTNPLRYSRKLKKYIECFKDNVLYLPGEKAGLLTEEGVEAYKEAIKSLETEERKEPLIPSKGLCKVCENILVEAQKDADKVENINIDKIIKKYGTYRGYLSRLFEFGGEAPDQIISNLIVCDGDISRSQRKSLFSTEVKQVGVASGKHDIYRQCTVVLTTSDFRNNDDSNDEGLIEGQYVFEKDNDNDKNKDNNNEDDDDEEDEYEAGLVSINTTKTFVIEDGRKKVLIRKDKTLDDGRKQIETIKKLCDENKK